MSDDDQHTEHHRTPDRLDVHLYVHGDLSGSADRKLDSLLALVGGMVRQGKVIMKELDDLTNQVHANTDAEQSAITLINGIADRIAAAAGDPAALTALSTELKASSDRLAAAVIANTPAVA